MGHTAGFLTTHVLDTATGVPAANVKIELFRLTDGRREKLVSTVTNSNGRTEKPILEEGQLTIGVYELVFHVGDYFASGAGKVANAFIDVVPVRFGINDAGSHFHVPLLVSPYSFTTYRGS